MRTENEMYNLIIEIANNDERIKAVYMNGSRTNPNVSKDIFQDYDVVYVVDETQSFIDDKNWINKFGNILYMQYPDDFSYEFSNTQHNIKDSYGWLMQFDDGNRVDLHVETIQHAIEHIHDDKLCKILLDKDNILPKIAKASDEEYYIKKPTQILFNETCNEFWWCTNNIAKGLWREEMPYVQDIVNFVVRKQLEKMLSWKIGIKTNFSVSVGKSAKYLYKWLDTKEYQKYLDTYFGGKLEEGWSAVFSMCDLFEETSKYIAQNLNYEINITEAKNARKFLEDVKKLPKDAKEIYPKV